ncbi:class I SAM-dependent methyltransferase [Brachyspira pilosicoli]|uniref:class I SAM-dependent methyltransferase n=1 Tax=Brachyspira pilosicoli TaxID=52584 RepID=UPI002542938E|nr:class I SAM-dependent methyltransferase [Brachyspira pilosicoli]WIH82290.1 class I SAM-dependent methyltransferase [Brachyspira pilosicoli]
MEESRKSIIVDHYINRVNDLNIPDYKVVDWESEEAQNLRFKALIEHFNMSGNVLLDVGCGVGSLAEYIDKNNINLYYIGIDIMPEMVERAKSKTYKNISPQFMTMDFFKKTDIKDDVDYIYTSGIFNLNLGNNEEFLKEAIEAFLLAARKGVCFNLLDVSCKEKYGDKYYYYKKDDILLLTQDILKKLNLSYKIHIEDKYLQNDFSVFIDY